MEFPNGNLSQQPQEYLSQVNLDVNTRSYANVTKTNEDSFPTNEQAIVLNVIEELKLLDYVSKVASIIGPKNILSASRISNNRICMYLANVQLVEQIVQQYHNTEIKGHPIIIRKFVTPAKRIILSNVLHAIPHKTIQDAIQRIGIVTVSPVSFLRASLANAEFSHILSFRRQVYAQPDPTIELPSSILVNHNGKDHRIFLTYDELVCFSCKQVGHIASRCPNQPQVTHISNMTNNSTTLHNTSSIVSLIDQPERQIRQETNTTPAIQEEQPSVTDLLQIDSVETDNDHGQSLPTLDPTQKKRPLSPSNSTIDTQSIESNNLAGASEKQDEFSRPLDIIKTTNRKKKMRKSDSLDSLNPIEELMLPSKHEIENASPPLTVSFEQICDFFENAYGNSDPLSLVKQYTEDIRGFLETLQRVHSLVTSKSIKTKCTKLKKKITKQLTQNFDTSSDQETDSSQKSSY